MNRPMDLARLADYFPPEDIEWLPGVTTKDKSKALAFPYVRNPAIMDRLDAVCGPENWRNAFTPGPDGGVLCGISIRITYPDGTSEWVTKWDGAENTDVEAVKGGLSSAQKRAAMQWGIGRYFPKFPAQWVRLDERGRFAETPRIPAEFLPPRAETSRRAEGNGSRPAGPFDGPAPQPGARRVIRPAAPARDA